MYNPPPNSPHKLSAHAKPTVIEQTLSIVYNFRKFLPWLDRYSIVLRVSPVFQYNTRFSERRLLSL